jgi:hypothetical protein
VPNDDACVPSCRGLSICPFSPRAWFDCWDDQVTEPTPEGPDCCPAICAAIDTPDEGWYVKCEGQPKQLLYLDDCAL